MELSIVQIGNSKGIRIPKSLLNQYNLKEKVLVDLKRDGWAESFKEMAENSDDQLILGDFKNTFDDEEWTDKDE